MKYVYPAVFTQEESGYSVRFPDIDGCFTCGDDLNDSLSMANDALSLMLVHFEDEKREIPEPTPIKKIKTQKDEFTTLISSDTTIYRRTLKNMAVKKTLSIPQWLNEAAMAAGLNFSQVLQEALKAKLGLA
ncbi:MAG: type II toxin-antitoxin system HicB family antitoxin [Lachnospiraceae bacterium]|nr:type II toxin-antitoxin system HicB family antitoxin [Lachnospiraceae bacterium]